MAHGFSLGALHRYHMQQKLLALVGLLALVLRYFHGEAEENRCRLIMSTRTGRINASRTGERRGIYAVAAPTVAVRGVVVTEHTMRNEEPQQI